MIEVTSLEKIFANQMALENVNFNVKKGETFGLLGPSGAGKTTTIKMLTGQLAPTSGTASVFNVPVTSLNKRSEEHTSELQSRGHLVCRLQLEEKNSPPD